MLTTSFGVMTAINSIQEEKRKKAFEDNKKLFEEVRLLRMKMRADIERQCRPQMRGE